MVLEQLGRKLEAYSTLEKALKIHKLLQTNYFGSFDSHQIWFNMGIIAWGMKDYEKAQENFCRALMAKFDFNKANAFYKASLGKISYLNSDWDEALYHYKEALPIFEQLIQNPGVLENDVAMWSVAVYICYADIIDICVKLNNIQSAIEYLEKVKGRYFKESLAGRSRRPTPVLSDSTADPIFQHYIDATNILSKASDYWILKSFPENYQPPDISFKYIVNNIIDNESVLIEYSCTTTAIYAFVITNYFSRIFIISENGNTDLESYFNLYLEKYNDYGKCIQNAEDQSAKNICRQEWLENLSSHFEKLSELLKLNDIICCINKLAPSCKKLIIIPHDFLYSLPIHAFPISIGDEDKLLIDYFSGGIRYAPSCTLIHLIEERQNHWKYFNNQENQDILSCLFAIQNPTEDLEYADIEVDAIKSLCTNSIILSGNDATKKEVCTKMSMMGMFPTCFHFACHGRFDFNNPFHSALQVHKNESIELREISNLGAMRNSPLVVLSACETALNNSGGLIDEYIGIPSAFLTIGAVNVISSLWKVDDVSTTFLMIKFYQNLQQPNQSVPLALNQAQQWLRFSTKAELSEWIESFPLFLEQPSQADSLEAKIQGYSSSEKPFYHPYYWAAFCSTGQ